MGLSCPILVAMCLQRTDRQRIYTVNSDSCALLDFRSTNEKRTPRIGRLILNPYISLPEMVVAITLLLTISAVMIPLARWLGIGPELGLLLSGIILGSSHFLSAGQIGRLTEISQLGVVFFLFVIGLELDPRKVWSLRRYAFGLGAIQVIGTGLAMMFYWRFVSPSWSLALLLGLVAANSSTALVLQLLKGKGELEQEYGQATLALLLFQDLSVVPILALLPVFAGTGSAEGFVWWDVLYAAGAMVIIFVVGRYLWPRLLRLAVAPNFDETFTAILFIALFGGAWLASSTGLSMAMGAFIAGLSLGSSEYKHRLEEEVLPLKNLLLGLFFVSVGLTVDLSVLSGHLARILLNILAIVVIKIVVLYLGRPGDERAAWCGGSDVLSPRPRQRIRFRGTWRVTGTRHRNAGSFLHRHHRRRGHDGHDAMA